MVKFNDLGLALGTVLNFYTSLAKVLKLKVRIFLGLIPTFVEVTGEKLVSGVFLPPIRNRVIKVVGLKACNFIEKRLQRRCFHVHIAKFLRTFILKNIRELLLQFLEPCQTSMS